MGKTYKDSQRIGQPKKRTKTKCALCGEDSRGYFYCDLCEKQMVRHTSTVQ
jgi:hypothetical protein